MRFARTGLSISKHSLVNAIHGRLHDILDLTVKYLCRAGIVTENLIVLEHFIGPFIQNAIVRDFGPHMVLLGGGLALRQRLDP